MIIIDRYIAITLCKAWLVVLVVLLAIFGLVAFVGELEHIGSEYQLPEVLLFMTYTLPQRALDLAPAITLLGTLLGLASLARHSELVVLRAAGMGLRRIVIAIAVPTFVLMLALGLLIEYVAAPLHQKAEAARNVMRSGDANLLEDKGLWSTDGLNYMNVREFRLGQIPEHIDLYQFDPTGKLRLAIHAKRAEVNDDRQWTLFDLEYKEVKEGQLTTRHIDELSMGPFWTREELPALSLSTAGMSLTGLREYVHYLRSRGQKANTYELAFWQKASIPFAAAAMVLLATALGAGLASPRGSLGKQIAIGAVIGILFYLGTQIIQTVGLIMELNIAFSVLTPILIVVAASAYLLVRER
ncbi:MAG: LPS export ABC transporter permease LptG [Pseudomonadales bacterium]